MVALGGAVLTVETDPGAVEERLGSGRLVCPGCSAVLARWGHARGRRVRDTDGGLWIVPRRARCTGCGATLRYRLLHTAARIVRGQRKRKIKIPEVWPWADELAAAFHAALALPAPT